MPKHDTTRIFEDFINKADDMNARINADTEAYRKGRARLTLKDENGNVLEGARIKYSQTKHEFKFGANCFMLDELESDYKNAEYKKLFANAFNLATIPFYWDTLEPIKGKPRYAADSPKSYRRPAPDLCLDFCEKNGIEPKLHCLNYDHFVPTWYKNAPIPEQKRLLEKRFREIAERYADKIPGIEVTNEHLWKYGVSSAFYASDDYIDWSYRMAERYFPNNELIINEGPNNTWWVADMPMDRQFYYLLIEKAKAHGARIDKIGMQYHIWKYNPDEYKNTRIIFDPDCLFRTMDTYGKLAPELQVTEITLPATGGEEQDEDYQAEVLERLYRIWFSHKNMQAVIYWNLVDGYAYGAKQGDMTMGENIHYGGLVNFDLTPKKAYDKLIKLTKDEWHSEGEIVTDKDGKADFKGFYGKYDVEITFGDKAYKKVIDTSKYSKNEITLSI